MPEVSAVGRGDVKTPPLWHTVAKMSGGRWYTDGSFHGPFPLMASSMELEKDRPFDALMTAVIPNQLRLREDAVTDGNVRDKVLANAPDAQHGFFAVPKVIE